MKWKMKMKFVIEKEIQSVTVHTVHSRSLDRSLIVLQLIFFSAQQLLVMPSLLLRVLPLRYHHYCGAGMGTHVFHLDKKGPAASRSRSNQTLIGMKFNLHTYGSVRLRSQQSSLPGHPFAVLAITSLLFTQHT